MEFIVHFGVCTVSDVTASVNSERTLELTLEFNRNILKSITKPLTTSAEVRFGYPSNFYTFCQEFTKNIVITYT